MCGRLPVAPRDKKSRRSYQRTEFAADLHSVFGIYTHNDAVNIHPLVIDANKYKSTAFWSVRNDFFPLVTAKMTITNQNIHINSIIVEVMFTGSTQHVRGETKARTISLSVRNDIQQHFQMTCTVPSKEYHQRLMSLSSKQYASGNRNGVGCSSAVIKNIIRSKTGNAV